MQIDYATNHSILKRQTFQIHKYFGPWETLREPCNFEKVNNVHTCSFKKKE